MFPKGPRFPAVKVPQVPGPNAYNPQEPDFDAYKHGAFLEKTTRFMKENVPDVPGPGAYDADAAAKTTRSSSRAGKPVTDRSAALQHKLEELERIHAENKKSHHLDLEHLKLELSRAQKSAAEHAERADKLKKQNDALESRVQELKKTGTSDQADLRELRMKLRVAEHERAQLAAKQGSAGEARQVLQAAESRRKEEVRERERKLAEVEKGLNSERKKRELAEARLADMKSKGDEELQAARVVANSLEAQLRDTRAAAQQMKGALLDLQKRTGDEEEGLLQRLEQHRMLVAQVATEYGRLASTTVPLSVHSRIKEESAILQMRVLRLERKLANAEGQVIELVNLIRHTKEDKQFLSARLREVDAETAFYSQALKDITQEERLDEPSIYRDLDNSLFSMGHEVLQSQASVQQGLVADSSVWSEFYRLRSDTLLLHSSALVKGLSNAEIQLEQSAAELAQAEGKYTELRATLEAAQVAHAEAQRQLSETTASLQISQVAEASTKKQLEDTRAKAQADVSRVEQALRTQKDANHRLAETAQKCRAAEEALQTEVDQMASELAQAERYQEAYNSLLEEVDALVSRNALAEEEAQRISRFNAEILGHNNPNQRIMYVDRIRRELYETKQKLLMSTRDRDAVAVNNEDLRHELELYKSVAVPPEMKPRTTVTRVGRVPLAIQNVNVISGTRPSESAKSLSSTGSLKKLEPMPEVEKGREI
ncbi:hypothetical protein BKA93DRAFT_731459 [Sparassis latifolia]